jgi:methionine transaminase
MPAMIPTSRLPSTGISIFTVMSRLAEEHGAINLAQGFPDFDAAPALTALAGAWFARGCNQYAPMAGVMRLREELAGLIERQHGARYDPGTEITITAGATEALFSTITALVHPGDEVLLFEPCYDSYVPAVQLAGGIPVFVTLRYPHYRVEWEAVRSKLGERTRLVVVNSPHNPTGTMWSPEDVRQLAGLLDGTRVMVVSDEVYEHLTFDGRRHVSIGSIPELARRAAVISSFGKSFHTTGWKIGYVTAPAAITNEIRRVHQLVTFAVNTPLQHAYAEFLARGVNAAAVGRFYEAKRDRFLALVSGSRLRALPCAGTYFVLMDYTAVGTGGDHDMAMRLLRDHGVASIPTSAFLYGSEAPPVLRFCFAKQDATLERAADRLQAV